MKIISILNEEYSSEHGTTEREAFFKLGQSNPNAFLKKFYGEDNNEYSGEELIFYIMYEGELDVEKVSKVLKKDYNTELINYE